MSDQRCQQIEYMDAESFDREQTDASFRFIEWTNRVFGGQRIVWQFVREQARQTSAERPLRVLDIGSGSCDIPIAVCKRARRAGMHLDVVCVEPNPHAVARARRHLDGEDKSLPLRIRIEDIARHQPSEPYDIAVASMVCHHFSNDQIVDLVRMLRTYVRNSLLINDLGRCWPNLLGATLLTLPCSRVVRHDATISVKRGFLPGELQEVLTRMDNVDVQTGWCWPFRVVARVQLGKAPSETHQIPQSPELR